MKYKRVSFFVVIIILLILNFLLISGVFANNMQEIAMLSKADSVEAKIYYNSGGFEKARKKTGGSTKNGNSITFETDTNEETGEENRYLFFNTKDINGTSRWDLDINSTKRYVVFELDVSTNSKFPDCELIKDTSKVKIVGFSNDASENTNKIYLINEKKYIAIDNDNKWTTVAIVFDMQDKKVVANYINGEKTNDNDDEPLIQQENYSGDSLIRFSVKSGSKVNSNIKIDNYKIYDGTEPRNDVLNNEPTPVINPKFDDESTTYERPNQDKIVAQFKNTSHPRVMINQEDVKRIRQNYTNDINVKKWGNNIIDNANQIVADYYEDEDKVLPIYDTSKGNLLSVSRNVLSKTEILAMAYLLTKTENVDNNNFESDYNYIDYADVLYTILNKAGGFDDWYPDEYLSVSEMCAAFAIGYDWLYDYWDDNQKGILEEAIYNNSLLDTNWEYYIKLSSHWVNKVGNWNIVCNGGNLMGAVAIFDSANGKYEEIAAENISLAIRSMEYFVETFNPDGAWEEGLDYWVYAFRYAARTISTLDSTFETDFGLSKAPGFANTALFSVAATGIKGINNFGDASLKYYYYNDERSIDVYFWFANKFDDLGEDIAKLRLYNLQKGHPSSIFDIIWYDKSYSDSNFNFENKNLFKQYYYFKGIEFVTMRNSYTDNNGTYLSYHAGSQDTNHPQLDAGTFVFEIGGVRWAIDLGKEKSSLSGSGVQGRFQMYRNLPEGHNVYVINPSNFNYLNSDIANNNYGQTYNTNSSEVEITKSNGKKNFSIVNLKNAYENDVVEAKRGYMLDDNLTSAVIRDEIQFKENDSEIYWFMHTSDGSMFSDDKENWIDPIEENKNEHTDNELKNLDSSIKAENIIKFENNIIYIKKDDKILKFSIDTNLNNVEIGVMEAKTISATSPGALEIDISNLIKSKDQNYKYKYYKLYLKGNAPDNNEKYYIQCKMILDDNPNADVEMNNVDLDKWSLDDKLTIKINNYEETTDRRYIRKIYPKTTVNEILQNIETNGSATIYNKNNEQIIDKSIKIGTGMKVKIILNSEVIEYTLVVTGDATGDGEIDIKDIFSINRHRLNKVLLKNDNLLAADANNDGEVNVKDIFMINKYRLGKIDIL